MTEPIVSAGLHLDRISDKRARDVLRQAADEAKHGPVWIVNRAGRRIGAIVSEGTAEVLGVLTRAPDGAGETTVLGEDLAAQAEVCSPRPAEG
jgi:hypothetical protein